MKEASAAASGWPQAYGARNVDLPLGHGTVVRFGAERLEVRATPGHTTGCLSFVTRRRRACLHR